MLVSYGTPANAPLYIPPTRLVIVGTATFPAVGYESLVADHTSMGTGALFSEAMFPPAFQRAVQSPDPNLSGPELVFVRMRKGVSAGCRSGRHAAHRRRRRTRSSPRTPTPAVTTSSSSASSIRPRS